MKLDRLDRTVSGAVLDADVVIVGGGACGLTLARALSDQAVRVLVLESGEVEETKEHAALNAVELDPACADPAMAEMRGWYHSVLAEHWSADVQGYGVRCRGLGGSTIAWAGKCAPFEAIDYTARSWVPGSGWPVTANEMEPYITRAEAVLGLGPSQYDAGFWTVLGRDAPRPDLPDDPWHSVFWQFARSSLSPTEIRRFGKEFIAAAPDNVRVILGATVQRINVDPSGAFRDVIARGLDGSEVTVRAPSCVLAASAVENARLLLASPSPQGHALGNAKDQVGRNLIDHVGAVLGQFGAEDAAQMTARYGFFSYRYADRTRLAMHGLALSDAAQRRDALLNGAVYIAEERAPDDPFSALGRLLRRDSDAPFEDLKFVALSPGRVMRGIGVKVLESGKLPPKLSTQIADTALRLFPNTVASDVRFGKLPHKFTGARVEGICEQAPDPTNRVMLSDRTDALGQRLPLVHWQVGAAERKTLIAMAGYFADSMKDAGLPEPVLADWAREGLASAAQVTDMGHSMGTTRMSRTPETGVVDADAQVFGVPGLYVAGGSVLPTGGHANPTLMMLALTARLADHLAARLAQTRRAA